MGMKRYKYIHVQTSRCHDILHLGKFEFFVEFVSFLFPIIFFCIGRGFDGHFIYTFQIL